MKGALLLCGWLVLVATEPASAHEVRPAYLEIRETAAGYQVLWKQPARGETALRLSPTFPDSCNVVGPGDSELLPGALLRRLTLSCQGGLAGKTIQIEGLEATLTDVLVRVQLLDGTEESHLLRAAAPSVTIGGTQGSGARAVAFVRLGIEHILLGIDHLLFVLALLILVKGTRRLVETVTAFTLAHSLTLAGATLGFVHVPAAPVEAAIALSIVFVAAEIIHSREGKVGLTEKYPWIVAFTFGLLHGFGFASALREVGLPQTAIPMALLCFNVGVEVGQLLFITGAFAVIALARQITRRLALPQPAWSWRLPPYAIGSVAMLWLLQRVAAFGN